MKFQVLGLDYDELGTILSTFNGYLGNMRLWAWTLTTKYYVTYIRFWRVPREHQIMYLNHKHIVTPYLLLAGAIGIPILVLGPHSLYIYIYIYIIINHQQFLFIILSGFGGR